MSELLHSVHALRDLAGSTPEPARSWAAAIAHVWSPGEGPWPRVAHPMLRGGWTPALMADPRLPAAPFGAGTAALILEAPRLGAAPAPDPRDGLREAFEAAVPHDQVELALALASLGHLEGGQLRAVAATADRASLAALVMHLAAPRGDGASAASDAIPALGDDELRLCLDLLGAPRARATHTDVDDIVSQVARETGAAKPTAPSARGSRRGRGAAWVEQLLDGDESAIAHTLRASLGTRRGAEIQRDLVRSAAWIALYTPTDDPVHDVLLRGGADDPTSLRRARAAGRLALPEQAAHADGDLLLAEPSAASLRAALTRRPDLAPAFVPAAPDVIIQALSHSDRRAAALHAAAWAPTFDVLSALLELPVPFATHERRAYGWALACMGDPVATAHLQALAASDPELDLSAPNQLVTALGLAP